MLKIEEEEKVKKKEKQEVAADYIWKVATTMVSACAGYIRIHKVVPS
jgi:hypothetical protein